MYKVLQLSDLNVKELRKDIMIFWFGLRPSILQYATATYVIFRQVSYIVVSVICQVTSILYVLKKNQTQTKSLVFIPFQLLLNCKRKSDFAILRFCSSIEQNPNYQLHHLLIYINIRSNLKFHWLFILFIYLKRMFWFPK